MPRKRKSTGGATPSTQAKRARKRLAAQSELPLQNQFHLQLPQSIVQAPQLYQQAPQLPLHLFLSPQQPREGMIFHPCNLLITLVCMI